MDEQLKFEMNNDEFEMAMQVDLDSGVDIHKAQEIADLLKDYDFTVILRTLYHLINSLCNHAYMNGDASNTDIAVDQYKYFAALWARHLKRTEPDAKILSGLCEENNE